MVGDLQSFRMIFFDPDIGIRENPQVGDTNQNRIPLTTSATFENVLLASIVIQLSQTFRTADLDSLEDHLGGAPSCPSCPTTASLSGKSVAAGRPDQYPMHSPNAQVEFSTTS